MLYYNQKETKEVTKMTYQVYTVRKTPSGYITNCVRRGVSREIALEVKNTRMANPNRTCDYVLVANSREQEFFAAIEKASEPLRKQWAIDQQKKERKWEKLSEMYLKGYRVLDTLAYVNKI